MWPRDRWKQILALSITDGQAALYDADSTN